MMIKKHVVVLEAEGGPDKWLDGHRKDTMPIVHSLRKKGVSAEVLFFRDDWADELYRYISERADFVIVRINPGNLPQGEETLFATLRRLHDHDIPVDPHPDAMIRFGSKEALAKLAGTPLVPADTYVYRTVSEFEAACPGTLRTGPRVIKQNRGSTGSGIWRVEVADPDEADRTAGTGDILVKCTEAVDNHVEELSLAAFMAGCHAYLEDPFGAIVDCPYLSRIIEGEFRVLMVGQEPVFVVHKQPVQGEDSFSATIVAGASYTYHSPETFPDLVDLFTSSIPIMHERLGGDEIQPLIWTGDFIPWTDTLGNDTYVLGEINCSCVGFFSHLDRGIQERIADEVISRIRQ